MFPSFDENAHNRNLDFSNGDPEELLDFIDEGEHQHQDFKFRIDSSQKIARTLSAFANTGGGHLLIGVKDNGRITGVDPEEEFYMVQGASDVFCIPPIPLTTEVFEYEGKLVLKVNVESSPLSPHFVKEDGNRQTAYIRQADENFAANKVLIRFMRDKNPVTKRPNLVAYGPVERKLFDLLSEENSITVSKFCRKAKIPRYKGEKTLATFLKWGILDFKASEEGISFSLKEDL